MNLSEIFTFPSKEQEQYDQQLFETRIFPFGAEKQKAIELNLLRQVIFTRCGDDELIYQLTSVKDILSRKTAYEDKALSEWYNSFLVEVFPPAERANLIALAELEKDCASLDDFPSPLEIVNRANTLLSEKIPDITE